MRPMQRLPVFRGFRPLRSSLILTLVMAACVAERKAEPIKGNLLVGAKVETSGIPNTDRLTDGRTPQEGDFWDTENSARFDKPDSRLTWDLGQPRSIRCALLQGDNNDNYLLSGSADGQTWKPLWQGGPADGAGMRLRQTTIEPAAGDGVRFVRLSASGGDQLYSVGELAVFAECPAGWPKIDLPRVETVSPDAGGAGGVWTVSLGLFALALVVFIVLTRRRSEPPNIEPPSENEPPPL
jgi:MYXO-CTERM domain-containing protein